MLPNTNPETGVRYGVIAVNNLDPDVAHELQFGLDARDLSYEEAVADLRAEFEGKWDAAMEEAEIAATETDPNMGDSQREKFIENYMLEHEYGFSVGATTYVFERDEWVEYQLEREADWIRGDEPEIEGEYDGVEYRISWLGGAPLLWVTEGPVGYAKQLCSPCVPNAANLDGGFADTASEEYAYECYIVPSDWLGG